MAEINFQNGMSEKRMGEIALMLVKHRLMKSALPAPNDFRREIGNVAKEIGVDQTDLLMLYEVLLPEIIGKMLGYERVSMTTGGR